MSEYLLYYAGCDRITEQIGLAVSTDGVNFERAGEGGLIVPIDRSAEWRAKRTANPAVVREGEGFAMLFQGISEGPEHTSIAIARSQDGRQWACPDEPCLTWRDMARFDPRQDPANRAAVFEPSVLYEDGRFRMWFLYLNEPAHGSNSLFYGESATGEDWEIEPTALLSGETFGFCVLHYPQVLRTAAGYELYFTLRSRRTLVDAIYRATSPDGLSWGPAEAILRRPLRVVRSGHNIAGKALHRLARPTWDLVDRLARRDANAHGYSHPHVLPGESPSAMYIHNDHRTRPRGRWYDISRLELEAGRWTRARKVLEPARDPAAWDSYFVADPYVVVL
jgi:hypothetical protein